MVDKLGALDFGIVVDGAVAQAEEIARAVVGGAVKLFGDEDAVRNASAALATATGAEVQPPLATVVIG